MTLSILAKLGGFVANNEIVRNYTGLHPVTMVSINCLSELCVYAFGYEEKSVHLLLPDMRDPLLHSPNANLNILL